MSDSVPSRENPPTKTKYAYEKWEMGAITKDPKFEGLFGVNFEHSIKELNRRNKVVESRVEEIAQSMNVYQERFEYVDDLVQNDLDVRYDALKSGDQNLLTF